MYTREVYHCRNEFLPCLTGVCGVECVHALQIQPAGSSWQLQQLKNLAFNYVQLEAGFDELVPTSRRANNNAYCVSNKIAATTTAAGSASRSKQDALMTIKSAGSIVELQQVICPTGRRYKLNLWALDRHGTVEIRHAAGTQNAAKAAAYILLWLALADASIGQGASLAPTPTKGYHFENLLRFYGDHPVLVHWMTRRRLELRPKIRTGATPGSRSSNADGTPRCNCEECSNSRS